MYSYLIAGASKLSTVIFINVQIHKKSSFIYESTYCREREREKKLEKLLQIFVEYIENINIYKS